MLTGGGSLNVLMLDEKRVVVERRQEPLTRAFERWGFEAIACSFEDYALRRPAAQRAQDDA